MALSFSWTDHALERLPERGLSRESIEWAVRRLHPFREANDGTADWQIDAGRFVVLYDHPHRNNIDVVHIVTAWPKRRKPRRHLRLISDDPDSYPEA